MSTITVTDRISGAVTGLLRISGTLTSGTGEIGGNVTVPETVAGEYYDGPYAVIPDETTQMLPTRTMVMSDNVTIAPIPNNYGRIAWNGTTLIVY